MGKRILVTGAAGFIGYHLTLALLHKGYEVVGVDNINDYYDVSLKFERLLNCGINQHKIEWLKRVQSMTYPHYQFVRVNLEDKTNLLSIFKESVFDVVINLAAQAGVRYSIDNPDTYIQSNVVGFLNVLEGCRATKVKHLLYASSSSVYGLNEKIPFSVHDNVDRPVSLYAATKKANELMAHTYSHLYGIITSGLRFFTVYGPWGRPDMAYFLFANAIIDGQPIKVFNHGKLRRDFTYIDDIVAGIMNIVEEGLGNTCREGKFGGCNIVEAPYRLYNIGNNKPVELLRFIRLIEEALGKNAVLDMLEMQQGDVYETWADIDDLIRKFNYSPNTSIEAGIEKFITWYRQYYQC